MPVNVRLIFPYRGISDSSAFVDQTPGTVPRGTTQNVWPHDVALGRYRGGKRAGLKSIFFDSDGNQSQVDGSEGLPIQALASASIPKATSDVVEDSLEEIVGTSKAQAALAAVNHLFLDTVPSIEYYGDVDLSSLSVAANDRAANDTASVVACAVNESKDKVVSCINYTPTTPSRVAVRITCHDASDHSVLWSKTALSTSGFVDLYANSVCCTDRYAFVACAAGGNKAGEVLIIDMDDGTILKRWRTGWADEYVSVRVVTLNGTKYLYVAFDGSTAITSLVGGALANGRVIPTSTEVGIYSKHYRSGVMRLSIDESASVNANSILTVDTTYNNEVGATDPRHELSGNITYHRISFTSKNSPYGCVIRGMWVDSLGCAYIIRSNRGWGPTSAFRPDSGPFVSTCKISSDGSYLMWEEHSPQTDIQNGHGSGYYNDGTDHFHYNDIPVDGDAASPLASLTAITGDNFGRVFVAGRCCDFTDDSTNYPDGYSVYAISSESGAVIWRQNVNNLTDTVAEGGIAVDSDGNLLVTGIMNTDWYGSERVITVNDVSIANPTTLTCTAGHNLEVGDSVTLAGFNTTNALNGPNAVTAIPSAISFKVAVDVSVVVDEDGTATVNDGASLWKLSGYDGKIIWAFDLGASGPVGGACIASLGSGRYFWGTEYGV